MRLCSFEDDAVDGLEPLVAARTAGDLLCGATSLMHKQQRAFRSTSNAMLVRPAVAKIATEKHVSIAVNQSDWLMRGPTLLVNARWVPPKRFVPPSASSPSFVACIDNHVAYAWLTTELLSACTPHTVNEVLAESVLKVTNFQGVGKLVQRPWDLVEWNGEQICIDFTFHRGDDVGARPSTMSLVGSSDLLWIDDTARVDPFVVADTTNGPVLIDRDAVVTSFTRLEGPCYVGPRTQVFSGNIRAGSSFGPNCRVGGEVSASVLIGHSNKSHEGYLGHSYLGEWVNLGSGTHTSDLRNDYGPVQVVTSRGSVSTGLTKAGCYLGDHAKAGVGCRLNAGSNIGPFAQLLPAAGLLPKFVPAFCSVEHGRLVEGTAPQALFEAGERMMARRGDELSPAQRSTYFAMFQREVNLRRTAIHESELRRLRRAT